MDYPTYYFNIDPDDPVVRVEGWLTRARTTTFVSEIHSLRFCTESGRDFGIVPHPTQWILNERHERVVIEGRDLNFFQCHFSGSTFHFLSVLYLGAWARRRPLVLLYFLCRLTRAKPIMFLFLDIDAHKLQNTVLRTMCLPKELFQRVILFM